MRDNKLEKIVAQLIFNLLIIVVLSIALYMARDWPSETALFPRTIGFPILALSVVSLILVLIRARRELAMVAGDIPSYRSNFPTKATVIFGWLGGFILAIWAFGFESAVPLFMFLYMKLQGKQSWLTCALFTAVATAFIILVFGWLFQVSWPRGAVWVILGF